MGRAREAIEIAQRFESAARIRAAGGVAATPSRIYEAAASMLRDHAKALEVLAQLLDEEERARAVDDRTPHSEDTYDRARALVVGS